MSDGNGQTIPIAKDDELPTTCLSCGMYTDSFVTVKGAQTQRTYVEDKNKDSSPGLGCLLFFLGPLGMLISLVLTLTNKSKTPRTMKAKDITVKQKIKVPQCALCQSEGKLNSSGVHDGVFEFQAHSNFVSAYRSLNDDLAP